MAVLFRKGWLVRKLDNRAWQYVVATPREEYTAQLLDQALDTAPDRKAGLALLVRRLTPGETDELRRILDAVAGSPAGG